MFAKIIFLIICIVILVAISIIHWLCTQPYDFGDWFTGEYIWAWWLGAIIIFSILYGFIFWSWKIMLIIMASFVAIGIVVGILAYLINTKDSRQQSKDERNAIKYERKVYSFFKNLITYPTISQFFTIENDRFTEHLNTIKKKISDKLIELKNDADLDINQAPYFQLNKFYQSSREEILNFKNKLNVAEDNKQIIINFFTNLYEKLNNIVLNLNEEVYKAFLQKKGKVVTENTNALHIYDIIPDRFQDVAKSNLQPYLDIFELENFLRIYINIKYFQKYGNYDLEKLLKNCTAVQSKAHARMKDDEKQGWKKPRGETIVFYVDFSELKALMTNNDNWQLFADDFKNNDFIKLRIDELYQIRINIAHNVALSEDEIKMINTLSNQIYNQLSKYKQAIKSWNI